VWAASSIFESRAYRFAEGWRSDLDPVTCTKDSNKKDLSGSVGMSVQKNQSTATTSTTSKGPSTATAPPSGTPAAGNKTASTDPSLEAAIRALQEERLQGQFHEIQQRIKHHFSQLITYYSYSFATTIMVGILAAIAAITLLFITVKGWVPSSQYQKTIFLLATVTATYCAAFPGVFQLQRNIDDNRFLYLKYIDVANQMCSYQATNESLDRGAVDPSVFIHQIDTTLGSLNKIAVGSELSQIPDFTKALNQALGQTGAGNTGEAQTKSPQSSKRGPQTRK